MLVDLLCASASIEPLRRDLELMNVVHHCRNLVALLVSFTFARSPHVFYGVRLSTSASVSIASLIEAGKMTLESRTEDIRCSKTLAA